jgi:hypothetical protein
VGLRTRFLDLLARGERAERDPEEVVEVADVPLHIGPILVASLKERGIEASGVESYDIRSSVTTRMRIMVRRKDLEPASAVIDELT